MIKSHPCLVKIKNDHNHPLHCPAALKYRDLCPEVKKKLIDLFYRGHSPSSALKCHKTDLMIEKGEDYYKVAADGMFMPTNSVVNHLFEKEFSKKYGSISGEKMIQNLKALLCDYEATTGGKANFQYTENGENYYVVLCTPLMLRAHEKIIQASELVMLDASGGVDKQRHRIYFFVVPCVAGSLPLGVIITDSEKRQVFTEALKCFQTVLPPSAFYYKKYPEIFLTDNDLKEIAAIEKVYPLSKTLLCQFHMLKAFWTWLCDSKHSISKENRQEIYFLFHKLLYSKDMMTAKNNLNSLLQCCAKHSYKNLILHITGMMQKKEKWLLCYRNSLPLRGNNTTNYVEVIFKVLKDTVLDRTMAFNLTQLVDFILSRFDNYIYQRLTDFINGRHSSCLYRHQVMLKAVQKEIENFKVSEGATNGIYEICDKKDNACIYTVDVARGICSCYIGSCGKLCEHAAAVLTSLELSGRTGFNFLGQKAKEDIFYVTEGKLPDADWFLPLTGSALKKNAVCYDEVPIYTTPKDDDMTANTDEIIANDSNCEIRLQIKEIFDRIDKGIESNPDVFLPAAKKMVKNVSKFGSTETGLVSGMHTFCTYSGVQPILKTNCIKNKKRRSHKSIIGVQPTAIARRKYSFAGKKNIASGRPRNEVKVNPALRLHSYTTFGHLPSRKRKSVHDLNTCVFDNKALGKTKHVKSN